MCCVQFADIKLHDFWELRLHFQTITSGCILKLPTRVAAHCTHKEMTIWETHAYIMWWAGGLSCGITKNVPKKLKQWWWFNYRYSFNARGDLWDWYWWLWVIWMSTVQNMLQLKQKVEKKWRINKYMNSLSVEFYKQGNVNSVWLTIVVYGTELFTCLAFLPWLWGLLNVACFPSCFFLFFYHSKHVPHFFPSSIIKWGLFSL